MVLLIITANLIIREAEILKVFGEFVMSSSPIMSEEAFDPLPKISVRVFTRARIVNLIGTKSCVLQFLYSSVARARSLKTPTTVCWAFIAIAVLLSLCIMQKNLYLSRGR